MYTVIDCQSFAGGFTLGAVQAGFKLVGKREMRGGFGVQNCERNRQLLGDNWQSEAVDPIEWSVPDGGADLLIGNPPCSGFSVLSSKTFRGQDSKINHCMWAFVEYAARVRPQVAVFESVQLAYTQGADLMRRLRARLEELTGESWHLYHVLHNALSVGGPAMRKRYFWVASRVPFGVEKPQLVEIPVLEDVIGDLRDLRQTWELQRYVHKPSWYSVQFRNPSRAVDGHIGLDNPQTRRVRELLEYGEWNPGDHTQVVTRRYFDMHGDLPPSWRPQLDKLKGNDFFQGFNTPIMWTPENHARVVTGAGLLTAVHWAEKRTFTHRECARVLGFPDDWRIEPLRGVSGLFLTWGKGITVHCGRWIAEWVRRALDGEPGSYVGNLTGERESLIDVTHSWRDVYVTVNLSVSPSRADGDGVKVTEPVETAPEAVAESSSKRGRPRPAETQERDQKVFDALTEPLSRDALTQRLVESGVMSDASKSLVYLSLWRLRRAGRVARSHTNGAHVWAQVEVPAA